MGMLIVLRYVGGQSTQGATRAEYSRNASITLTASESTSFADIKAIIYNIWDIRKISIHLKFILDLISEHLSYNFSISSLFTMKMVGEPFLTEQCQEIGFTWLSCTLSLNKSD